MLTTLLLSFTMLLLQPSTAPATEKKVDKAEFLAAVDRFMERPALADAQTINKFAEESEDCLVAITPNVLTWMQKQPAYKQNPLLLTAFIAGNVKSQLASGKVADDPYAGLLSAIQLYDKLRNADTNLKIPEIDELMALEKKGELKAWAQKAANEAQERQGGK